MVEKEQNHYELQIKNVGKVFELPDGELEVLQDINIDIMKGEFVAIIGTSGCGKSSLLRLIDGLEPITSGQIQIGEDTVTEPSERVSFIFQEARLLPWLSIQDNIAFGIHKKVSKDEKRLLVQKYIDLVGLTGFEKARPKQLSGGMQQRASIARSLISEPEVLLLDEPFGALDALTRINMQQEILKIWSEDKKTMILVTHDIEEAVFLADRIIIMTNKKGHIKREVKVDLSRPRRRNSSEFVDIKKSIMADFFEDQDIVPEYFI